MVSLRKQPCSVCPEVSAEYTCPRCSASYCSLKCYKAHNSRCTNTFYHDTAMQCMKDDVVPAELRDHTVAILERDRLSHLEAEEEELAEADMDALEQAAAKLALLDDGSVDHAAAVTEVLNSLPPVYRERFRASLASGAALEVLSQVQATPWYLSDPPKVTDASESGTDGPGGYPPLPFPTPPLSTLAPRVSPLLHYNCMEVMYSYCYSLRVFHGEWSTDPDGFLGLAVAISRTLQPALAPQDRQRCPSMLQASSTSSDPRALDTVGTRTHTCYERLEDVWAAVLDDRSRWALYDNGTDFAVAVMDDVRVVLMERHKVLRALADLNAVLAAHLISLRKAKTRAQKSTAKYERQFWMLVQRKVQFYISWTSEQSPQAFAHWSMLVEGAMEEQQRSLVTQAPKSVKLPFDSTDGKGTSNASTAPSVPKPRNLQTANKVLIEEIG
uniref:HIT-type domain-containing protein n=1 Tax=Eutreptiella gymnastica TaxID=73025 RepID=A0A7S1IKS6_9EUGL|mmetsp:Transcript_25203/g.45545  ORF Transcript_25203/g.45545 Transcript_25203/m.45545 type:complete len:442 (+) Transcript_25203:91-1416(+)